MHYRNVLKRFKIDRLPNESHEDFMVRSDEITEVERFNKGKELYIDTDEYTTFIFDESDLSEKGTIVSAVVEIHEIPMRVKCDFYTLLLYHDNIKQEDEIGKITSIDLDEAEGSVMDQIIQFKSCLHHIKNLQERGNDL